MIRYQYKLTWGHLRKGASWVQTHFEYHVATEESYEEAYQWAEELLEEIRKDFGGDLIVGIYLEVKRLDNA